VIFGLLLEPKKKNPPPIIINGIRFDISLKTLSYNSIQSPEIWVSNVKENRPINIPNRAKRSLLFQLNALNNNTLEEININPLRAYKKKCLTMVKTK
jgi:hypothetical protein